MPLTIQYCSDLHLEFEMNRKWINKYPLAVKGDVLLLGGDIVLFAQIEQHNDFFDFVADNYKAAYWIPGNHEYYHADIAHRSGTLHEAIRDNVFLVNNTSITIDDTDIICATLWSHINPAHEWEITRAMSDFHVIKHAERKLNIEEYNRLHLQGRQFVENAIAGSTAKHKIVLTHHVPTLMNYPEKYKGDVLNEAFATELHNLIESSEADCWIYGHTHCNTPDFKIGNTQILTNQLGYVKHGEHKDFNNSKIVTLR
jgi:predicted phosphohydrolase